MMVGVVRKNLGQPPKAVAGAGGSDLEQPGRLVAERLRVACPGSGPQFLHTPDGPAGRFPGLSHSRRLSATLSGRARVLTDSSVLPNLADVEERARGHHAVPLSNVVWVDERKE